MSVSFRFLVHTKVDFILTGLSFSTKLGGVPMKRSKHHRGFTYSPQFGKQYGTRFVFEGSDSGSSTGSEPSIIKKYRREARARRSRFYEDLESEPSSDAV